MYCALNPASHRFVAGFPWIFKIKIVRPPKAMSGQLHRAATSAKRDTRKKRESNSDSDDSAELVEKLDKKQRIKEQTAKLRQTR